MKTNNQHILLVLNQLYLTSRIYCEKSKYQERNYYTCLISNITVYQVNLLYNLIKHDRNIKSIIIKQFTNKYHRVSVYLMSKHDMTKKRYIQHKLDSKSLHRFTIKESEK